MNTFNSRFPSAADMESSPKMVVHFNSMTTTVSNETVPPSPVSLQIIVLPTEYSTVEAVSELLNKTMMLGEPSNIRIVEKKNYNQKMKADVVTRSALIDFKHWYNTDATRDLYDKLQSMKSVAANGYRAPSVTVVMNEANLHWDNGELMNHMSFREARPGSGVVPEKVSNQNDKMDLSAEDWNSLYIPVLPNNMYLLHPDNTVTSFQPRFLKTFIENELNLGKVSRVDFIDREMENAGTVKAVFIHFEQWNDNANARYLREKLNTDGHFRQRGYYDGKYMHKFLVRNDNGDKVEGYFAFKINHKPIPEAETELNMAQLVAANKVLTEKMAERDEEIRLLKEQLATYNNASCSTVDENQSAELDVSAAAASA
jgi:hypothetical protein